MFQKKVVEKYLSNLDKRELKEKYELFQSIFGSKEKQANIRASKEEQYQEGFVRDLFCKVFGYTIKPEANYNILTELKNDSKTNTKKSDAAIIIENEVKAVIELKGTDTQDLNKVAFQAFSYKNHHEKCNYVIVANFERLDFYVETQSEYIEFNLFNLSKEKFDLLYLLLEINQIKNDIPLKLKHETQSEEKEITDKFYSDYSTFKRCLFEDLCENNPALDKLLLFKKTQKLLDRILFILFCEDRNLLPTNSTMGIISDYKKLKEMGYYQPLYNVFKTFFDRIDKGFKHESDSSRDVFAYNGGLFKTDEILDNVKVGDDVLYIHTKRLSDYDFESQISVDILGRIFENSLTEIEEIQEEIRAEKDDAAVGNKGLKSLDNIGKRKKDGVFYTPEYITRYIVESTIGTLCSAKKDELKINDAEFASDKKYTKKQVEELDARLETYRSWLLSLKILDPACGSGAFLNAALRELRKQHTLIDYFWAKIHNGELNFSQIDNAILENNLYGVDINEDSIEITKLSLWLHTATKNRKLTTLNEKIKVGNSLIDDKAVAGEKAFDWEMEFPEVFQINASFNKEQSNKGLQPLVKLDSVDFSKERLFHVTTATHNSRPSSRKEAFEWDFTSSVSLSVENERIVYESVANVIAERKYKVLAFNICRNHMHILIACKDETELSEIVRNIKGRSSYELHRAKDYPVPAHLWTQKFGHNEIHSYEQLENVVNYIEHNREKHGLPPLWKEETTSGGFDVVIGNPPYVNMVNILDEKQRKFYQTHYKTVKNKSDLYSIFTERAQQLLKPNGLFGFIFSNSWMGTQSFTAFREFLAKDVKVYKLVEIPDYIFRDATVKTCICFYKNEKPTENDAIDIEICNGGTFSSKGFVLPYRQILSSPNFSFSFDARIELNKIETIPLGEIASFSLGIKTSDDARFVFTEKKDDDCYLFLRGRNIQRWGKCHNDEWLWYKPELITQKPGGRPRVFENFVVPQKIVIQDISQEITATIDDEKYLCNDTLNIIYELKNGYDMKFILALLNSKLVNFWFKQNYQSGLHIKLNQLETIPVPAIADNKGLKPLAAAVAALADQMLSHHSDLQRKATRFIGRIKESYALSKTSSALESFYTLTFADFAKELAKQKIKLTLKQKDELEDYFTDYVKEIATLIEQIAATDSEINALVYKLYGLNEEEIAIVENSR